MCYLYLKQYEQSIECLETANSMERNEMTLSQLGRLLRLVGREEDAINAYMEAIDLCPENPELLTTVGL